MIAPQTKSTEILDELRESIESGEVLLDEFTLRKLLKTAESIPTPDERLSITGLIKILMGRIEEGCSLCERAIHINPTQFANWTNYNSLLSSFSMFSTLKKLIYEGINNVHLCPSLFPMIVNYTSVCLDDEILNLLIDKAEKMNIELDSVSNQYDQRAFYFILNDSKKASRIKELAFNTLLFIENKKIKNIATKFEVDMDDIWGFNCLLRNITIEELSQLNDELFDYLYDKNIDMTDCYSILELMEE
ncbi:hypothetical protein ACV772_000017 [Proteus mirabilis]|uniref:hypothetical protein n=1 Tax=Proteus mirabilis TaxID=584 RepID=UPI0028B77D99|nr:hypothetical protein [Proteus mirabilis]HEJ9439769.1 hypothetical protein [Proteus mirabilis]HEK3183495.1 hypothetical protein [Proteus mirabilis]